MTKKDYIIVAGVIKDWIGRTTDGEFDLIRRHSAYRGTNFVEALSEKLKHDNPKFDAEKFAEACGLPKVVNECKYCERLDACEGIKCACDCHT